MKTACVRVCAGVCACVCARVRACMRVCVRVRMGVRALGKDDKVVNLTGLQFTACYGISCLHFSVIACKNMPNRLPDATK